MYTMKLPQVAGGRVYQLRCAKKINRIIKKYEEMYIVMEKSHEPDIWRIFSVPDYLKMNFRKGEVMVLYAYGNDRTEEEQILKEIFQSMH